MFCKHLKMHHIQPLVIISGLDHYQCTRDAECHFLRHFDIWIINQHTHNTSPYVGRKFMLSGKRYYIWEFAPIFEIANYGRNIIIIIHLNKTMWHHHPTVSRRYMRFVWVSSTTSGYLLSSDYLEFETNKFLTTARDGQSWVYSSEKGLSCGHRQDMKILWKQSGWNRIKLLIYRTSLR